MNDNKNTILAIVLSALVLIGWQYFFAGPQEKARQEQQAQQQAELEIGIARFGVELDCLLDRRDRRR